jgi:hypothetical protein
LLDNYTLVREMSAARAACLSELVG